MQSGRARKQCKQLLHCAAPATCSTFIIKVNSPYNTAIFFHVVSYSVFFICIYIYITRGLLRPYSSISLRLNSLLMLMEQRDMKRAACDAKELLCSAAWKPLHFKNATQCLVAEGLPLTRSLFTQTVAKWTDVLHFSWNSEKKDAMPRWDSQLGNSKHQTGEADFHGFSIVSATNSNHRACWEKREFLTLVCLFARFASDPFSSTIKKITEASQTAALASALNWSVLSLTVYGRKYLELKIGVSALKQAIKGELLTDSAVCLCSTEPYDVSRLISPVFQIAVLLFWFRLSRVFVQQQ